jgi:hypothetical protein
MVYPENWSRLDEAPGTICSLAPITYLGGAAVALTLAESDIVRASAELSLYPAILGPFCMLVSYIQRRKALGSDVQLSDLPVPDEFKQIFHDWAERKVNFIAPAPSQILTF